MPTSSSWTVTLTPREPHPILLDGVLHLKMATVSGDATPGRTSLIADVKEKRYTLCSLSNNLTEQPLDIRFAEDDEAILTVRGVHSVTLSGDYVKEDPDFELSFEELEEVQEELEQEERELRRLNKLRFRDTEDQRFLEGFDLSHFGLASPNSEHDTVNLREEEETEEERKLNDNILQSLINSMLNSGDDAKIAKAKQLQETTQLRESFTVSKTLTHRKQKIKHRAKKRRKSK
ncbi:uncharacterized protein BYT42DRAFT_605479 [Radiomyces spectabilis]|uniref:uncharacterized protein n=1 Tax=Radiomyces spectabilis TaxID=64574 RepID=UPI00221FA279|nr:uncharacterized protein BYT42DRAFT_605479 [Radiomyces spectabilis]KAI8377908.1 hypothetical protein BYT42DRAFT_605479 [Radiomyces spectabilis]